MAQELSVLFDKQGKYIREWRIRAKLVQLDACTWSLTYFIRGTGTHNFRRSTQRHDLRITATRGSLQSVTEQAMRRLREAAVQLTEIPSGQLAPIASVWSHIPN